MSVASQSLALNSASPTNCSRASVFEDPFRLLRSSLSLLRNLPRSVNIVWRFSLCARNLETENLADIPCSSAAPREKGANQEARQGEISNPNQKSVARRERNP